MKTRLFVAAILLACYGCTPKFYTPKIENGKLEGVLPVVDGRVQYVVEKRTSKGNPEEVFRQVRRWAALHVNDPSIVFELGDNKLYDVVSSYGIRSYLIKPSKNEFPYISPKVRFAVIVECNKNGYRLTLGNFLRGHMQGEPVSKEALWSALEEPLPARKNQYVSHLRKIEEEVTEAITSLGKFVEENI